MSNKLNQEELLQKWARECSYNHDCHDCKHAPECGQAYQQIKEMIQKPEVTEEWIEEKAKKLTTLFYRFMEAGREYDKVSNDYVITKAKEIIRSFIEEIRGK